MIRRGLITLITLFSHFYLATEHMTRGLISLMSLLAHFYLANRPLRRHFRGMSVHTAPFQAPEKLWLLKGTGFSPYLSGCNKRGFKPLRGLIPLRPTAANWIANRERSDALPGLRVFGRE
jgi:hypothetical protein